MHHRRGTTRVDGGVGGEPLLEQLGHHPLPAIAAVLGGHLHLDGQRPEVLPSHQVGGATRSQQHHHAGVLRGARRKLVERRHARAAADQQSQRARSRRREAAAQRAEGTDPVPRCRIAQQRGAAARHLVEDLHGGSEPLAADPVDRHGARQQGVGALGAAPGSGGEHDELARLESGPVLLEAQHQTMVGATFVVVREHRSKAAQGNGRRRHDGGPGVVVGAVVRASSRASSPPGWDGRRRCSCSNPWAA